MACSLKFLLIFSLNFLITTSISLNPILPKAAILQVTKDLSTLQYVAKLFKGDNLAPVNLVIDLNGPLVWTNCDSIPSSSHQPIKISSLECSMAKSIAFCSKNGIEPEYNSKTCTLPTENTISRISTSGELIEDKLGFGLLDVINPGSNQFLFSCAPNLLLKELANGANGMLGLGNSRISLTSQISIKFGFFQRKFSICLSQSNGVIFLGGSPKISNSMIYTPLISSDLQKGYFINVNSVKIQGKKLSFHQKGILTKISTIVPYTTMESNIFGKFAEAYIRAAFSMNLTLVPSLAPFEVCFNSKGAEKKRVGENVPIVDFILQSEMVKWRIYGENLMVHVNDEVMCLGILDGGLSPQDSIVIGGYQLEDYLLEFNLGNSMLGFSSMGEKKCSDFEGSALISSL